MQRWIMEKVPEVAALGGVVVFVTIGVVLLATNPAGITSSPDPEESGPDAPLQPLVVFMAAGSFFAAAGCVCLIYLGLRRRVRARRSGKALSDSAVTASDEQPSDEPRQGT